MERAKPLPDYLAKRYFGWKATDFDKNKAWYQRLAEEGQRPRAMVITCCDSRVHITSIFGAETGEFFIHRNIANLIPPYRPDEDFHGTSAAIEYAVKHLKVSNILLVGHSICGGVQGCFDMCTGNAPELEDQSSFIGRWMDILKPGFDAIYDRKIGPARALERHPLRRAGMLRPGQKHLFGCLGLAAFHLIEQIRDLISKLRVRDYNFTQHHVAQSTPERFFAIPANHPKLLGQLLGTIESEFFHSHLRLSPIMLGLKNRLSSFGFQTDFQVLRKYCLHAATFMLELKGQLRGHA